MKELSIFVDESGDFGEYAKHSPYYIITMVLHDQGNDICNDIAKLKSELRNLGYEKDFVVHTGPLIRKEEIYCEMSPADRRAIFTKLYFFTLHADVKYQTFVFDKREFDDSFKLEGRMARNISLFFRDNLGYFQAFENVILYYDNGQKQITRMLNNILATELVNYSVKRVLPKNYVLFQVADLICTLSLIDTKCQSGDLNKSEEAIFHSKRLLYKQFIRPIKRKKFSYNGL